MAVSNRDRFVSTPLLMTPPRSEIFYHEEFQSRERREVAVRGRTLWNFDIWPGADPWDNNQNIWMTQEKNSAVFEEAFSKCRHVILFFSINKSMAFQGYVQSSPRPEISFVGGLRSLTTKSGSHGIRSGHGQATVLGQQLALEIVWAVPHPMVDHRRDAIQPRRASQERLQR